MTSGPVVTGHQHWSQLDRHANDTQTDVVDSMRQMLPLYEFFVDSVRDEIATSEIAARARVAEWETTLRFDIWVWDTTRESMCDAEGRSRIALVDSESAWRNVFFANAFALCLRDVGLDGCAAPNPHKSAPT